MKKKKPLVAHIATCCYNKQ